MMRMGTAAVLCSLARGPVSPGDLAYRLKRDPGIISNRLDVLSARGLLRHRGDGVCLEPTLGYDSEGLRRVVPTRYRITFREQVDSTNALASELPTPTPPSYHLVVAREQRAGRGRYERHWHSPPGGLWASILDGRNRPAPEVWIDQLAISVAITDVANCLGMQTAVKWPNDVVTPNDKKLAGVLVETTLRDGKIHRAICGVGINVDLQANELPDEATSFAAIVGTVEVIGIIPYLLHRFEYRREHPTETLDAWRSRSNTLGRGVSVETPDDQIMGTAQALTDRGKLVIEGNKEERTVSPAQCRRLRYTDTNAS